MLDWLNVQLPGSDQLAAWAQRSLWDQGIADRFGLDERFDVGSVATFFARAQGSGVSPGNLPDQPDGEADWQKLTQRAAAPVISVGQAFELQRRFRPAAGAGGDSVVAGVPAWTADNTADVMTMAGLSSKQQEWLAGLATEPINVRIIQTVLLEALKRPAIAAQAQAAFGAGVDWVAGAYLDHGLPAAVAGVAAAGIRAKAEDEANAELLESQKQLRAEHRAITLKRYAAGLLVTGDAVTQLTGDQYTAAMALEALADVDYEIGLTLLDSAVKSIREAYLAGQITIDQAAAQLTVLGVLEARRINYVQQWTWETIGEGADAIDWRNLGRAQAGIADAGGRLAAVGKSRLDGSGRYNRGSVGGARACGGPGTRGGVGGGEGRYSVPGSRAAKPA